MLNLVAFLIVQECCLNVHNLSSFEGSFDFNPGSIGGSAGQQSVRVSKSCADQGAGVVGNSHESGVKKGKMNV